MNPREKRLLAAIGGIVGIALAVWAGKVVFMKPLREIDKRTSTLREKLGKAQAERRAYFAAEEVVKHVTQRTFADQVDQASAKSGEMLTKLILVSGLREVDFSRLPVGPRKVRGANEIGWSVQGQGKLGLVVNLVFLLENLPQVHRIENLSISAGEMPGSVRVGFRMLTLVVDLAPAVDPLPPLDTVSFESAERQRLEGIVSRDLLRPYIKRPADKAGDATDNPAAASGPSNLKVVSLSDWMGQPEVHVRDLTNQRTLRYRLGDAIEDGTVAMVDYRPLPMPGNESLKSFSRVILKVGSDYWAVERGQSLSEKRRLTPDQLPDLLRKL